MGAEGEQEDLFPVFDSQETVYRGIIEELETANTLLSKSAGAYTGIDPNSDILYGGDPAKWRMMANSLMLRYYMRVSEKLPSYAQDGIEAIMSDQNTYPIFTSGDDDATMGYIGSSSADAWPNAIAFDVRERGRIKRKGDPLAGEIVKDKDGNPVMIPGSLKSVKAIGWFIEEYGVSKMRESNYVMRKKVN